MTLLFSYWQAYGRLSISYFFPIQNIKILTVTSGKLFFNHWMTVSNHRPFTYPDGRINISGDAKSREGGVKYTDYSLRKFFEMAEKQDW